MRVLFVGTVLFSKHILEEIIKSKVKIVGVIGGRKFGFNSDYFDLVKYSLFSSVSIMLFQYYHIYFNLFLYRE